MNEIELKHKDRAPVKRISAKAKEALSGYAFIAIPLLGFIIFTLTCIGFSVFMSFTDFNPIKGSMTYVGISNYKDIFNEESFKDATLNTILMLFSIPIGVFIGLALAVYLKRLAKGRTFLTILYYLPAVTSSVAIMIVFRELFKSGEYGLINGLLGTKLNWISNDPWLIKIAIIFKNIWGGIGGTMILYLAGLHNIPDSLYEVAEVQGASKWQQYIDITLPMAHPTTFYLIVTGIISGLQNYADSAVMGAGQQGSRTIVYYIWYYGIQQGKYGLASAASILLTIVILAITIVLFRRSDMIKGVK